MSPPTDNEFICGSCGSEIHPNAVACAYCHAPHRPGSRVAGPAKSWEQPNHLDGVDLPVDPDNDPDFDYGEFIAREFGESADSPVARDWKKFLWWLTALITLIAFAWLSVAYW